jgi:predicted NBD/HSP70 family sugar kinase
VRKIDIQDFQRATRDTPRAVNRRIILNLLREHGPLSRADLARWMDVPRGMITSLVNELLEEALVFEGATTAAPRGRRPTLLHLRSHDRLALGVDVRSSRTVLQVSDFSGDELARETFATPEDPAVFGRTVGEAVDDLLSKGRRAENLEGVGIVVPGMVDTRTGKVLNAPTLGWRDVQVARVILGSRTVPVHVERDAVACALAWIWHSDRRSENTGDFVYVVVSDGVGTGLVVNGQAVRGRHFTAGEFGHLPLDAEGPLCSCGSRGCLEAFTSDTATVARYLGLDREGREAAAAVRESGIDVATVIQRSREGQPEAGAALETTARHLGAGLALIINALDPARIVVGGEIVGAWDLIEPLVRSVVEARTLTAAAGRTPVTVDDDYAGTRLRGAATLVVAPAFAAPRIA